MLERLKSFFFTGRSDGSDVDSATESAYLPREKLLVFGISLILALCLWFIVNLSRDFTVTLSLPLDVLDVSEEMALVERPPDAVSVSVSGEGWTLISLYSNPPRVSVDIEDGEVNLYDRVQQQLSTFSDISVTQVEPIILQLEMEEKRSREVPVKVRVNVETRDRFGLIGDPVWEPSSVTVSGAASRVEEIDTVYTQETTLEGVNEDIDVQIQLQRPYSGLQINPESIDYRVSVAEFTEGEVRVPVRVRNLPPGQSVTYNPTTINVRYEVPIDQYNDVRNSTPFIAYVDFQTIDEDTTGIVSPEIERSDDQYNVRLRSHQPRSVSYFHVLDH